MFNIQSESEVILTFLKTEVLEAMVGLCFFIVWYSHEANV